MSMKCDIIIAGVGGQGVLSLAGIIAWTALKEGHYVKQAEVHGMAQRGGAVMSHLRIADGPIASDLVPRGGADLIISMEPLESLRYLEYLSKDGTVVTSTTPVVNIPDYPNIDVLLDKIRALRHAILVDSEGIARSVGLSKAVNIVMVGAAFHLLPLGVDTMTHFIRDALKSKGEKVIAANLRAFELGRAGCREGDAVETR